MVGVPTEAVMVAQALATAVMTGVIWTVQVVHYPLFLRVPAEAFPEYERAHMRRIGCIVGPAMAVELVCAGFIAAQPERVGVSVALAWSGLALVGVVWILTATVQGPLHQRLAEGKDDRRIRVLVASNWVRTVAWSARMVVVVLMLLQHAGSEPA